jgi:ribosomal protein S27E
MNGIGRGSQADIVCNECGEIVRTVPATELQQTLCHMVLTLDVASARCPHCAAVHLVPGFSKLLAFICDECGATVTVSDDGNVNGPLQ